jgi:hypothetical protein
MSGDEDQQPHFGQIPVPTIYFQTFFFVDWTVTPPSPYAMVITEGPSAAPAPEWLSSWGGLSSPNMEGWFWPGSPGSWPNGLRLLCQERRGGVQPGYPPPQASSYRPLGRDSTSGSSGWTPCSSIPDTTIYLVNKLVCNAVGGTTPYVSPIKDQFGVALASLGGSPASVHWYRRRTTGLTSAFVATAGGAPFVPEPGDYIEFTKATSALNPALWDLRAAALT